jgi:hypothetical protein
MHLSEASVKSHARMFNREIRAPAMEKRTGSTVGYNGKRYARVFNSASNRHEWWEAEKIGRHKQPSGSVKLDLKFVKRAPNTLVPELWRVHLEKIVQRIIQEGQGSLSSQLVAIFICHRMPWTAELLDDLEEFVESRESEAAYNMLDDQYSRDPG